jgi:ParB/RepB/Spo0J family partition protein
MARSKTAPAPKPAAKKSQVPFTNPLLARLPRPDLVHVPPANLNLNPRNPAGNRDVPESIGELAASIQQHGVLQPLIARGEKTSSGWASLELIAGERRLRAAVHLELASVPVLVFKNEDLTNARALEIALVENLQRIDQAPLTEALAYNLLRTTCQLSIEDIAAHVGRSISHVQRRLALLGLSPLMVGLLSAGWMTTGAAEQLARASDHAHQLAAARVTLGAPHQDPRFEGALGAIAAGKVSQGPLQENGSKATEPPLTAYQARRGLEMTSRVLSEAPWDLANLELVPRAGSCLACPKRSEAQATLFGASSSETCEDFCMDEACWKEKLAAHTRLVVESAKAAGAVVLSAGESNQFYSGSMLRSNAVVDLDAPCEIPGRHGSWRTAAKKILPDLEVSLAVDGEGVPHSLVNRRALEGAARAAGLIKPDKVEVRDGDDARRANNLADLRRKREASDRIMAEVLSEAGRDTTAYRESSIELLARALWGRAQTETKREMARRRATLSPGYKIEALEAEFGAALRLSGEHARWQALSRWAVEIAASTPFHGFFGLELSQVVQAEVDETGLELALVLSAVAHNVDVYPSEPEKPAARGARKVKAGAKAPAVSKKKPAAKSAGKSKTKGGR